MSRKFFHPCTNQFLWLVVILVLTACAMPPTTPISFPTTSPQAGTEMPLLTMLEYGYQFRYPSEYQAAVFQNLVCLSQGQVFGPPGRCQGHSLSIEAVEVAGRSLSEWADLAVPNATERLSLTIGGEEAIQLDYISGLDRKRLVIILHGERRFLLEFVGWPEGQAETSQVGILYDTVISSFEFLPETNSGGEVPSSGGASAIIPATIYRWPALDALQVGILEAGSSAKVVGYVSLNSGSWLHIFCPDGFSADCWIVWDRNSVYYGFGLPVPFTVPDPSSLKIVSSTTTNSPDGRWQALVTRSETVTLGGEGAWYFYTKLIVTSLRDGTTWTPVSEWRAALLDEDSPPQIFYWTKDSRFLFFTSISHPEASCVFFHNIGASLDRLDTTDGSVIGLQPPDAAGYAAISPDETMLAYITSKPYALLVRDLAKAFTPGDDPQGSVKWNIGLKSIPHDVIIQVAWSTDNRKVWITLTELEEDCFVPPNVQAWELDVETGEFIEVPSTVVPTAAP